MAKIKYLSRSLQKWRQYNHSVKNNGGMLKALRKYVGGGVWRGGGFFNENIGVMANVI